MCRVLGKFSCQILTCRENEPKFCHSSGQIVVPTGRTDFRDDAFFGAWFFAGRPFFSDVPQQSQQMKVAMVSFAGLSCR